VLVGEGTKIFLKIRILRADHCAFGRFLVATEDTENTEIFSHRFTLITQISSLFFKLTGIAGLGSICFETWAARCEWSSVKKQKCGYYKTWRII